MDYPLNQRDWQIISKLPPEIASLADRYPSEILNTADSWDEEPFPNGYIPESIEVYCGDEEVVFIIDGLLDFYQPTTIGRNSTSLTVMIDSNFAYIEIEGKEILNKLGGVVLPDIVNYPSEVLTEIAGELS
ncbi:hypothetical protein H6G76_29270 [Nostoc sp. FACHB-152]|uniref:hypothetical protein n=1 Tax=unclassified Nostoc TaxID=2593658 RepID=UPI0016894AA8|nr:MULTISPECIES: hypothetical protein [unclassified Nostoc]MBD2451149.1 hypothetical protein [Nostoc sp. FACHB-152]MBD2472914.1 hypothetical protein [Nostoc sp. FACHB-145]